MRESIDYTGLKQGKMEVIERIGTQNGSPLWFCKCDCGNYFNANSREIRSGKRNCGCVPKNKKDLTGKRYGKLTVEKYIGSDKKGVHWLCVCDCGNKIELTRQQLYEGRKDCGCEKSKRKPIYRDRLHRIWQGMKSRCYNPNNEKYYRYGGRNIVVCDEWLNDYDTFKEWALSHGYEENLSIDRIDNDGDYCPENCRWATVKEQNNNTSRNHLLTYNGETHTVAEWAEIIGIDRYTLLDRINKSNWDVERALTTPVKNVLFN